MYLYQPISLRGQCPDYQGALPTLTYELCGDQGVSVAVGNPVLSIVYRGVFDRRNGTGSWNYSYSKSGAAGLTEPPFDIDYACRIALVRINNFIENWAA